MKIWNWGVEEIDEAGITHTLQNFPTKLKYEPMERLLATASLVTQYSSYKEEFESIARLQFRLSGRLNFEDAHVIPAPVHRGYLAKKNDPPFVVGELGKLLRQFIFTYGLAKYFIWMLRNYDGV
ncbi:hypothetical protein B0H13DRAFT_2675808 [Mycena leptocephala]|nr:hypothetical protein B0H13DRAFT_2675808 [Mycena leptocephala]